MNPSTIEEIRRHNWAASRQPRPGVVGVIVRSSSSTSPEETGEHVVAIIEWRSDITGRLYGHGKLANRGMSLMQAPREDALRGLGGDAQ